jgi:periplasmic protein TonB
MAAVLPGGYYANESGKRLFLWAMAGSLTLHLALLFLFPLLGDAPAMRVVPPPLTARLAEPKPPAAAPQSIEPPVQPHLAPRPAPAAKAVTQPPARAPQPPARILSVEPAPQAAQPAVAIPAAPAVPAAPAAGTESASAQQPGSAASGPDPGTVGQFRLELMKLARGYKKYPRIAQDNSWEGRVELRIAIGEDGAISSLTVKKSTGRAVLDDEAQAMIRAAKSRAAIPPGLRGKAFTLEIAVDFLLKEEER